MRNSRQSVLNLKTIDHALALINDDPDRSHIVGIEQGFLENSDPDYRGFTPENRLALNELLKENAWIDKFL